MLSDDELYQILDERDCENAVYRDAEHELERRELDRADASSGTVPS